ITNNALPVRSLMGTPLYMAPELFDGASPGVASDVYAIGVLLYRLVTAQFPAQAQTIGDVRRAHLATQLRPIRELRPDVPAAFVEIVERCLEHQPDRRYPTAAALDESLRRVDRRPHRRGALWVSGIAGATVLAAALIIFIFFFHRSPQ